MPFARRVAAVPRVLVRSARLSLHLIWGLILAGWLAWRHGEAWFTVRQGQLHRQHWLCTLTRILGLHVHAHGTPISTRGLLVANHISWLDIVAIASCVPTTFVAKHNVRTWPLIGTLAKWSGTVFLRRGKVSILNATIDSLAKVITEGQLVTIFPEGTTTTGTTVGPFHRALFQAAVNSSAPVQAIAVSYPQNGRPNTTAPFVNDDGFLPHLLRIMAESRTDVHIDFQERVKGLNRRELATYTRQQICVALKGTLEAPLHEHGMAEQRAAGETPSSLGSQA